MIRTKNEFLSLWRAGKLGNRLRTWKTLDEAEGYDGLFSIRDGRPNSNLCRYNVPRDGIDRAVAEMTALGGRGLYFGEMAPDHRLTIQGEFLDGEQHGQVFNRSLTYSTEKTQMKRVTQWRHTEGAAAVAILRSYLDGNSYDDLLTLQTKYPDHVIEFSAYECCLGDVPGRNTIIWELRGRY